MDSAWRELFSDTSLPDVLDDDAWAPRLSFTQPNRIGDAGRQAGAWKRPLYSRLSSFQLFETLGFVFRAQDAFGRHGNSKCTRSPGASDAAR